MNEELKNAVRKYLNAKAELEAAKRDAPGTKRHRRAFDEEWRAFNAVANIAVRIYRELFGEEEQK